MGDSIDILIISPFHGGSHRAWAEGYQARSSHDVRLLTLPARYWKWRMHGGAVTLARRFRRLPRPDRIMVTDMLDLATFRALAGPGAAEIPTVLYMHENQLTYPLPADPTTGPMRRQGGERDLHYAFINFASMLAADCVLFNSHFHRDSFLAELPRFLRHFPEDRELGAVKRIERRSSVLGVGLRLDELRAARIEDAALPPLILWNQRWEYDKNPEAFFDGLDRLKEMKVDFRLAVCGECFQKQPTVFQAARKRLSVHIAHWGFATREEYCRLLWEASIVVSTSFHEFFGISVLEAIACESLPLLPRRLSYPELIPKEFHAECLYSTQDSMVRRLSEAIEDPGRTRTRARQLAPHSRRYDWEVLAPEYDRVLESATIAQD